MDVARLYPQYNIMNERRKQSTSFSPNSNIPFERRSGIDRRSDDRVQLDTNLTRDIFEVKNKVNQMQQKASPQKTHTVNFSRNIEKAALNSINTDQFIKTIKPNQIETPKQIEKAKTEAGSLGGIATAMLGGIMASALLGTAAVGVAVGLGVYFGLKLVKNAIATHFNDKEN